MAITSGYHSHLELLISCLDIITIIDQVIVSNG